MERISFNQLIQDTVNNQEEWKYYKNMPDINKFDINSKDMCVLFIKDFFKHSKKIPYYQSFQDYLKYLDDYRLKHILSVFFLGLGIYSREETIHKLLDKKIKDYEVLFSCKPECNFNFIYFWFLVCLFHDLGYLLEEGIKKDGKVEMIKPDPDVESYQMDESVEVPDCYKTIIDNYYDRKKNRIVPEKYRGVDHGIYGGKYMYKTLKSIRDVEYYCNPDKSEKEMWGPELDNVFRLTSWVIMCHNIFFAYKTEDYEIYKQEKLCSLIIHDHNYPIKYDNNPLFFFFVLIDTIEPIKRFNSLEPLKNIFISIENDIISIENELSDDNKKEYNLPNLNLNAWLTKVEIDGNRTNIYLHP